jgi:hypothetical protein
MRANSLVPQRHGLFFLTLLIAEPALWAADGGPAVPAALTIQSSEASIRLQWHPPGEGLALPTEFRLQRTTDLNHWENVGAKLRRPAGSSAGWAADDTSGGPHVFYRLMVRPGITFTSSDPAQILGLGGAFLDELALRKDLTTAEFLRRYNATVEYLPKISFDPAEASFWGLYQDPAPLQTNRTVAGPRVGPGFSFALDASELERLNQNGFVVSERLGAPDFGEIYYRIFNRDLPVFITTDSILHAWHRSHGALLADLERGYIVFALEELLNAMAAQIPAAAAEYGSGILRASLEDADYHLAVARSLLTGTPAPSALGQQTRVAQTLEAIGSEAYMPFTIFDIEDYVDFSQFKPRGHYRRYGLENYFRAMMWCGRVDLRVAGNRAWSSLRQLGAAMVLQDLWQRSGAADAWRDIHRLLEVLVGRSDSMTLEQLAVLLRARGMEAPASIGSMDQLEALRAELEAGTLGVQEIQGHSFAGGLGGQGKLPRSFSLFGQRFTLDSWAMNQVTFDRVAIPGSHPPEWLRRRRSYSLDVAFSVFANDQTVPELVANMTNPGGVRFRDGFSYQHNLAAVRAAIDQLPPEAWADSLYTLWLSALRTLSLPTTGPEYPEAMRTQAWAMKSLNTQLASWTQLRHDTVLYAKPLEVPPILCFYPAGFVEPRPEFFAGMSAMCRRARELLGGLEFELPRPVFIAPYGTVAEMRAKLETFLERFQETCDSLESIARGELAQQPLTEPQTALIDNWMEVILGYFGERQYNGHYPLLFLRGAEGMLPPDPESQTIELPVHDCSQPDELVVDVLTAGFSDPDGDPGAVLHEAVGHVNLLMIAIDNGPDRMVYAGPVLSHYEFERPLGDRLTDEAWKHLLKDGAAPAPPPWTAGFLAPRAE